VSIKIQFLNLLSGLLAVECGKRLLVKDNDITFTFLTIKIGGLVENYFISERCLMFNLGHNYTNNVTATDEYRRVQ
jgi:hypothetical protein